MLRKVITSLTPAYHKLNDPKVFSFLFAVALFIRLPFFFRDYVDRDESTFILMGQSWVDGHLPYTELWDLKPPLTFLFFAGIIKVFGKSFLAIRFFGTLMVTISAFFSYKIGRRLGSVQTAFWIGVFCVLLQSLFGSIQGVMSEHLCMAFFMPALYVMTTSRKGYGYVLSGLLMGTALMIKLNIAYAVLAVGIANIIVLARERDLWDSLRFSALYGIAILMVILLTLAPYALRDLSGTWWKSVVLAPLKYSGADRKSLLGLLVPILGVGLFIYWGWKRRLLPSNNPIIWLPVAAIAGILFSFLNVGRINSHYLIQLYPVLLVPAFLVISGLKVPFKFDYRPIAVVLLLLLPIETYLEYHAIVRNKMERDTFFNGEGFTVPQYIGQHNLETEDILFLGYHIGYWLLDERPPTKSATHPSNICREELFPLYDNPRTTAMEELAYLMERLRPKIVVVRKNRLVFDKKKVLENAYIDRYLKRHYKVIAVVDEAEILQRLK